MALHCLSSSSSSSALSQRLNSLSISVCSSSAPPRRLQPFKSLAFSTNVAGMALPRAGISMRPVEQGSPRRGGSVVCEAAPKKKADSASKRARQAEKRRIYNKAKKSEIKTRMKKVFEALDGLKKKTEAEAEELLPIEKLVAEAYSAIDKAVKVGTLHRNTGARRKSRLARRKKSVEIHHGWYTPALVA
uniref:Small ribosomal subunit protein bS20c n=1 Tax=Anthurium amnicola TaxID=1678845 RepID=A0A1D1ZL43_9ARAE